MSNPLVPNGQFILYVAEDGQTKIDVRSHSETVWLTQHEIAIERLEGRRTVRRQLKHYNLKLVISIRYRVSSKAKNRSKAPAGLTMCGNLLIIDRQSILGEPRLECGASRKSYSNPHRKSVKLRMLPPPRSDSMKAAAKPDHVEVPHLIGNDQLAYIDRYLSRSRVTVGGDSLREGGVKQGRE